MAKFFTLTNQVGSYTYMICLDVARFPAKQNTLSPFFSRPIHAVQGISDQLVTENVAAPPVFNSQAAAQAVFSDSSQLIFTFWFVASAGSENMEIVWQSTGSSGRKRSSQACNTCRTRKKRCYHTAAVERPYYPANRPPPEIGTMGTRDSSPSLSRVSLYNPESVLADLSMHPATRVDAIQPGLCQIHPHRRRHRIQSIENGSSADENTQRQLHWYARHRRRTVPLNLSEHYRRYLEDEGAFLHLPRSTANMLLPLYNTFLDELIPILNGGTMFRSYSNGHASIYLVRAVCLVACKIKQATPFLRLHENGPILSQADFASKLLAGLDAAMKADLEPDRVTKIQILALMHLHNDGLGGVDRSSNYLSQAICEAWSISLHVKIPVNADQEQCDLLWWALRNFDRINKPVMGAAPFIIDDTDIGVDRTSPRQDSYRSQLMAISLRLGDLMTKSTRVYKASSKATTDDRDDFPALTELTADIPLDRFSKSHRSYLHIWYHIAAMLSCRYSGPGTVQYIRRLTSADCVLRIVTQETPDGLPPLPLVPYAMSMSTTVIYRALRDGERLPELAYNDLEACSKNLEDLSQVWSSAKGVAKLVRRLPRYTSPDTFKRSPNEVDCTCEQSRPEVEDRISSASRINLSESHQEVNYDCLQPPNHSVSTPACDRDSLEGEGPVEVLSLHPQFNATWLGTDLSYTDIDRAFYDFLDYGMSSIFRDPATLEALQADDIQNISSFQ
ncbi:hypothetical protein LZ30DRAFT_118731 [Colletotrichum cereale]|nr:hypothetical protein LZ30DRAFT_118731 [Colletotrichum cereale]